MPARNRNGFRDRTCFGPLRLLTIIALCLIAGPASASSRSFWRWRRDRLIAVLGCRLRRTEQTFCDIAVSWDSIPSVFLCDGAFPCEDSRDTRRCLGAVGGRSQGQIVGQVLDPSSAAVAGGEVTVRNTNTNFTRTTTTDSEGRYAIPELPLGPYEVTVKAGGIRRGHRRRLCQPGSFGFLEFPSFRCAHYADRARWSPDAPGIEPTRSATKSILTDLQIHELPSEGRRLQNFVVDTPQALIEPECRGFSISGQKGIYSNISIDGGDYDSTWGCGIRARSESGPAFSLGAIQEIQVVRNTFSAEFGRSTGGVIQLSTKSGTNAFHGTVFELNRNGALSEPDAFGRESIASDNQFGGSFGGPIIKDRTFFFIAPEFQIASKPVAACSIRSGLRRHQERRGRKRLLQAAPQGNFNAISDAQSVITRIDHQLSQNNQFFGRFDFARTLQTNSPGANNLSTGLGIATTYHGGGVKSNHPAGYELHGAGPAHFHAFQQHLNELRIPIFPGGPAANPSGNRAAGHG